MRSPITPNMLIATSAGPSGLVDSHQLIVRLQLDRPAEFAVDRQRFSSCTDPVRAHNASLGRRFLGVPSLAKARRVRSMNVRGNVTINQQWRR